jgi:hypothetical protein
MGSSASPQADRHRISELTIPRICLGDPPTCLPHVDQRVGLTTLLRHPIALRHGWVGRPPKGLPLATHLGVGAHVVVLEYQPVVHRLRLSASA